MERLGKSVFQLRGRPPHGRASSCHQEQPVAPCWNGNWCNEDEFKFRKPWLGYASYRFLFGFCRSIMIQWNERDAMIDDAVACRNFALNSPIDARTLFRAKMPCHWMKITIDRSPITWGSYEAVSNVNRPWNKVEPLNRLMAGGTKEFRHRAWSMLPHFPQIDSLIKK